MNRTRVKADLHLSYLEVLDVDRTTRRSYEGYIRLHIRPLLGDLPVGKINGEILDSFYMKDYTLPQFQARVNEYMGAMGNKVDIWEMGN